MMTTLTIAVSNDIRRWPWGCVMRLVFFEWTVSCRGVKRHRERRAVNH